MEVSEALRCVEDGESGTIGITLAAEVKRLQKLQLDALTLEKQYSESLGRMAQLCDVVCPWVDRQIMGHAIVVPAEVVRAVSEIMEYVDAVRP